MEILDYLEKACQLIPDQGLTAECKEMVDSYYPIIIQIIVGELVSNMGTVQGLVCNWLGVLLYIRCRTQNPSFESPILDCPAPVTGTVGKITTRNTLKRALPCSVSKHFLFAVDLSGLCAKSIEIKSCYLNEKRSVGKGKCRTLNQGH